MGTKEMIRILQECIEYLKIPGANTLVLLGKLQPIIDRCKPKPNFADLPPGFDALFGKIK